MVCTLLQNIEVVLLDIEGTTTPISFVKKTLFGYIREKLNSYISMNFDSDEMQTDIAALKQQVALDVIAGLTDVTAIPEVVDVGKDGVIAAVVENVIKQMDADRKTTSLKKLQGHIWRSAYQNGEINGEVFSDIPGALQKLTSQNIKIYIYSSGSIEAQKLLFGFTSSGNLLEYISGHFDTSSGNKTSKESYINIADHLNLNPSKVLFLTDIPAEAVAAKSAGMQASLLSRPGNSPLSDADRDSFRVLSTFDELFC